MDTQETIRRARLYLIYTDDLSALPIEEALRQAVRGGVDLVQIREKGSLDRRLDLTRRALEALEGSGVPVIVNDDPDAAARAGAHGVHLGPDDLAPEEARRILPPGAVLGLSTTSLPDAEAALESGADYIGVGTVFPTSTKSGKAIIGPAGAAVVSAAISIPVFPIGGIDAAGAAALVRAGVIRAAVCSAIIDTSDVAERASAIAKILRASP